MRSVAQININICFPLSLSDKKPEVGDILKGNAYALRYRI